MRNTLPLAVLLLALAAPAPAAAAEPPTNPGRSRSEVRERAERAEAELNARRDRAAWAGRMARQGTISEAHRRAEERQLRIAEDAVARLRREAARGR